MTNTNANHEQKVFETPKAKTAILFIANGSEEIETATVFDVLVRAGFVVSTVGVGLPMEEHFVTLSRGLQTIPSHLVLDTSVAHPDVLVLPGGAAGTDVFSNSETVQNTIRRVFRKATDEEGKEFKKTYIATICAATKALVKAFNASSDTDKKDKGMGKYKVTGHPSVADYIKEQGWEYSEDSVVVDGNIITSKGPGTALEWSLKIVEELCGIEKRREVGKEMCLPDYLVV